MNRYFLGIEYNLNNNLVLKNRCRLPDAYGRMGLGFTLILLAKYGNTPRTAEFYADKYFKAFPGLLVEKNIHKPFVSDEHAAKYCYCYRNFERYLSYLGLVSITTAPGSFGLKALVQKTPLFDQLITVLKPQGFDSRVLH